MMYINDKEKKWMLCWGQDIMQKKMGKKKKKAGKILSLLPQSFFALILYLYFIVPKSIIKVIENILHYTSIN